MTVLSYSASSIIDTIRIEQNAGGAMRAYLHYSAQTEATKRQTLEKSIQDRGWQFVPTLQDEKPVLEVRGFDSQEQLTAFLHQQRALEGQATILEKEKNPGWGEWLKKKTFFLASPFYFLGDWKFFSYARKEMQTPATGAATKGNKLDMAAGGLYALGTLSSFLFGHKDPSDLQLHDMAAKFKDFMNEQHLTLPDDAAIHSYLNDEKKGLIKKADDFGRYFSTEMMHSFFAAAGMCIAVAAHKKLGDPIDEGKVAKYVLKQEAALLKKSSRTAISDAEKLLLKEKGARIVHKMHKASNWLDIGLGSLTFLAGVFINLVKEKKHDPDMPRKEGVAGIWERIQEHPLSVSASMLMVSTLCHGASTAIEWKMGTATGREAIFDRGIFVATNLIAELLVAVSSKGHGSGVKSDKSINQTAIALAADTIAREPVELQEMLIGKASQFLGQPEALAMRDTLVAEALRKQVNARRNEQSTQHGTPVETSAGPTAPAFETISITEAQPSHTTKFAPAAPKPTRETIPMWTEKDLKHPLALGRTA